MNAVIISKNVVLVAWIIHRLDIDTYTEVHDHVMISSGWKTSFWEWHCLVKKKQFARIWLFHSMIQLQRQPNKIFGAIFNRKVPKSLCLRLLRSHAHNFIKGILHNWPDRKHETKQTNWQLSPGSCSHYPRTGYCISAGWNRLFKRSYSSLWIVREITEMTVQKSSFPSFASIVSILSVLLYCAGFLRVELDLKDQKNRINHLENIVKTNPPSNDGSIVKPIKNVPGKFMVTFTINFSKMKATTIFDSLLTCYMWAKNNFKQQN